MTNIAGGTTIGGRSLSTSSGYSPAKEILTEIAYTFEDPDGNYIQQFQTHGFDARLWELYLYATLHENDFIIDRNYKAPDYVCTKYAQTIVVEATTVNPTKQSEVKGSGMETLEGIDLADYMAIKFSSVLSRKLEKRYWELDHVKGHPLILAVADFRKPKGVKFSAKFLMEYLYGLRQNEEGSSITYTPIKEHRFKGKKAPIPSGFFFQTNSENISAVLFSDNGTIAKFNRMGKLAAFGNSNVVMIRRGERYKSAQSVIPEKFKIKVDPRQYTETWSEGIWMFHNPRSPLPLDRELFGDAAHVYLENGQFVTYLSESFPIWSETLVLS